MTSVLDSQHKAITSNLAVLDWTYSSVRISKRSAQKMKCPANLSSLHNKNKPVRLVDIEDWTIALAVSQTH